jgi:hypothetical protein
MAGIDKIVIPQLGGDNWSVWKAKFCALLEYKGLYVAIEKPETVEGRKASGQAKALMILHTQDAYVKLIVGERTAAQAWKKLEDNFEKKSNARVIQLRKKLTGMKLGGGQSIAEYLSEIRELKVDLEAAGQTVTDTELVVFALNGLPKEYATLVEFLELGDSDLSLDEIQPKLMQREQKLKLQGGEDVNGEKDTATAYVAQREKSGERDFRRGTDTRTCYACGEMGHVKAVCRKRNVECYNCGERGHISSVCRKPRGGARGGVEDRKEFVGVAFTAWRKEAQAPASVWLVDSGSTQHVTAERSQFASYERLARTEKIEGLGGEALTAVGIGRVVLECETPNGPSVVTLKEVWHVPEARANLFAMRKATDAGAKILIEKGKAQFEMDGIVRMEAVQRGGLWEIATVRKARAFMALKTGAIGTERRVGELVVKKPQGEVAKKQREMKPVKMIEVDLDEDDARDNVTMTVMHDAAENVEATRLETGRETAEAVGATTSTGNVGHLAAESVGGRVATTVIETERVMSPNTEEKRYPERNRVAPVEFWRGETGWVTPKAKKRVDKSG